MINDDDDDDDGDDNVELGREPTKRRKGEENYELRPHNSNPLVSIPYFFLSVRAPARSNIRNIVLSNS